MGVVRDVEGFLFAMGRGAQGVCTYVKTGVWTKVRLFLVFFSRFFLSSPFLLSLSLLFFSIHLSLLVSSLYFLSSLLFSP